MPRTDDNWFHGKIADAMLLCLKADVPHPLFRFCFWSCNLALEHCWTCPAVRKCSEGSNRRFNTGQPEMCRNSLCIFRLWGISFAVASGSSIRLAVVTYFASRKLMSGPDCSLSLPLAAWTRFIPLQNTIFCQQEWTCNSFRGIQKWKCDFHYSQTQCNAGFRKYFCEHCGAALEITKLCLQTPILTTDLEEHIKQKN